MPELKELLLNLGDLSVARVISISFGLPLVVGISCFLMHVRHRRQERALDLLLAWAREYNPSSRAARHLVEQLNHSEVTQVILGNPVEFRVTDGGGIKTHCLESIKVLLGEAEASKLLASEGDKIKLSAFHVHRLRLKVIPLLNLLEAIAVAWEYGIADRKIIEDEFRKVVLPDEGTPVLANYRRGVARFGTFPSLGKFTKHLEAEPKPKPSFEQMLPIMEEVLSVLNRSSGISKSGK